MKTYTSPSMELILLSLRDTVTCSYGDLEELPEEGTELPWEWL